MAIVVNVCCDNFTTWSVLLTTLNAPAVINPIARYWSKIAIFASVMGSSGNIATPFGMEKLEWCGYPIVKKFDDMFNRFNRMPACGGRRDRQTSCDSIVRAMGSMAR